MLIALYSYANSGLLKVSPYKCFAISTIPTFPSFAWVGFTVHKVGLVSVGREEEEVEFWQRAWFHFHFSNRSSLMLTL